MKPFNIGYILLLIALFLVCCAKTQDCKTQIDSTGWNGPTISGLKFKGPIKCWVGYLCVWEVSLQWDSVSSTNTEITLSPTFTPPLFYTLPRANIKSFVANDTQFIEVPPLASNKVGQYQLSIVISGSGLTITSCTNFTVEVVPDVPVVTKQFNQALMDQYYDFYKTRVELFYPSLTTRCDPVFNPNDETNAFNYDPIFAFTISTVLNITNDDCLMNLKSKWLDYLYNNFTSVVPYDRVAVKIFPEGLLYHSRFYNKTFDPIPTLKFMTSIPNIVSIGGNRDFFVEMHQYLACCIAQMALTGEKNSLLPRMVSTMLDDFYSYWLDNEEEFFSVIVPMYTLTSLNYWYELTGDKRIPYMANLIAIKGMNKLNYSDTDVLYRASGDLDGDLTTYAAVGFSVAYKILGNEEYLAFALRSANGSLNYAYDGYGKHANQKARLNYMALSYLFNPGLITVNSTIPFEFPYLANDNGTTILPNTTFEITSNITIEGNLIIVNGGVIEISPGQVLTVVGCANLDGTLVVNLNDNGAIVNDTVLIEYGCREGQFNNLVVNGDDPNDCIEYSLLYSPKSVSMLVDTSTCNVANPDAPGLKDWGIALIVVLPIVAAGVIVTIILVLKKKKSKRASRGLNEKLTRTSAGSTTTRAQ